MPLHLRRRGAIYHARGVVRVGRQTVEVGEFSTGCNSRADAEAVAATEEARIRQDILEGPAGRARRATIAEAMLAYLQRPGGVPAYDAERIRGICEAVGSRPVIESAAAWTSAQSTLGGRWSPATAARWRAVYVAGLRAGCAAKGLPEPPKVPTVRERQVERVAHLHDDERAALLRSYNAHAMGPVLLLAYGGLRTQEALQLDWRHVNLRARTMLVDRTKSGKARLVPMHPKVDALLFGMWHASGKPARGPVFLSARGKSYADTRGQGGNPLDQAHETACERAGITDFRPHDWRHDFATRFLAEGGDVRSLMQIMGWSSPRMVQRYVTYRAEHLATVLARVG